MMMGVYKCPGPPRSDCLQDRSLPQAVPIRSLATHPSVHYKPPSKSRSTHCSALNAPSTTTTADCVVVGGGIVGLSISHSLLQAGSTVALIDKGVPCSGATGAGQGYLWLAHRNPHDTEAFAMARHSRLLWNAIIGRYNNRTTSRKSLIDPSDVGWVNTGSMLLATTYEETAMLEQRAQSLIQAGIQSTSLLTARQAMDLEPAISIPIDSGSALIVSSDSQIDGKLATYALLDCCEENGAAFTPFFHEEVGFISINDRQVTTSSRTIRATKDIIISAGAWSGDVLADRVVDREYSSWKGAVRARKGHLLEYAYPPNMPRLSHGLMEVGYTKHYNNSSSSNREGGMISSTTNSTERDITFTATSTAGRESILLGSSREFSESMTVDEGVVGAILERAAEYLPGVRDISPSRDLISARVGGRPYSRRGRPYVGRVEEGLVLAMGHEGSGLTLSWATAEMVVDVVVGRRTGKVPDGVVEFLQPMSV